MNRALLLELNRNALEKKNSECLLLFIDRNDKIK